MRISKDDLLKLSFRAVQQEIANPTSGTSWLAAFMGDTLEEMTEDQLELLGRIIDPGVELNDCWMCLRDEIREEIEFRCEDPEPTGAQEG